MAGRPRQFASDAERQAAYRARRAAAGGDPSISAGFALPAGYSWMVRISQGSTSFCAAVCKSEADAKKQADLLQSVLVPGAVISYTSVSRSL